jgi:hypothetical protein
VQEALLSKTNSIHRELTMVEMLLLVTHMVVFGKVHVFHQKNCTGLLKYRELNTTFKNPFWRNYSFDN